MPNAADIAKLKAEERANKTYEQRQTEALEAIADTLESMRGVLYSMASQPNRSSGIQRP